jgi:hypothetical protein
MAISLRGNIVTNGLVLNLDAANRKSYPGSGTAWNDLSGQNNTGTLTSNPTYNNINGGNFQFNGNNYAVISNTATITPGSGDFTFNCWINPSLWTGSWNNGVAGGYTAVYVSAGINGIWIGKSFNNFVLRAYSVADRLQYPVLPATGSWTNVSIARGNSTASLYYNGVFMTSSITTQNFAQYSTYIGSDGAPITLGSSTFSGSIAIVQMYNKALSSTEVLQNYNALKSRFGL